MTDNTPATGWDNPDEERARLGNISNMRVVHKQRGWGDIVDPDAELAAFLARCEAQDAGDYEMKKSTSMLHWCEGVFFVEIGPKVKPLNGLKAGFIAFDESHEIPEIFFHRPISRPRSVDWLRDGEWAETQGEDE